MFANWYVMPPMSGLNFLSLFILFGFEHHHHICYFAWHSQSFWILWISSCPRLRLGTIDHWGSFYIPLQSDCFFLILTLAPSMGCDLSQSLFSRNLQCSKGTVKDIFEYRERVIKDGYSSFQIHAFRISKLRFPSLWLIWNAKWFPIIIMNHY